MLDFLTGFGKLVLYFIIAASSALLLFRFCRLPREVMRKMLHIICVFAFLVLLYTNSTWYIAAVIAVVFALLVYPAIAWIERYPRIMRFFSERSPGEIKSSLMIAFFMVASLIAVFWGLLGEAYKGVILAAVLAWGLGDAAAALVGKALGKHPIRSRLVEGTKTAEGTIAMYLTSFIAIFLSLLLTHLAPWPLCLLIAFLTAFICAGVELISHHGLDTVTVPFAAAACIYCLLRLLGL